MRKRIFSILLSTMIAVSTLSMPVFAAGTDDSAKETVTAQIETSADTSFSVAKTGSTAAYAIVYKLNGGKNSSSNPKSYTSKSPTITLKAPTRKGYVFAGWYSDKKFKNRAKKIPTGSTGKKVFYAKWTPIKYNVKFDGNGATSGTMNNLTGIKYGKAYRLKANKFKKSGITFVGWNTKADGTGKPYRNKASIKNLTAKNGGTVTLYAQWKSPTYKITYVLNGGTNNPNNPTSYTSYTKTFSFSKPSKAGVTFDGWYSDAGFNTRVKKIKKGSSGNITLYAKWISSISQDEYKIFPNDGKDDTDAINDALLGASDRANGGVVTLTLRAGTYNVTIDDHGSAAAVLMRSNTELRLASGAVIQVKSQSVRQDCGVVGFFGVTNARLTGGKIQGAMRSADENDVYGVWIKSSRHVTVSGTEVTGNQCDGFYLSPQQTSGASIGNKYITIAKCKIHDNARSNISIVDADNVTIQGCNIYNSGERQPSCGIAIEPNRHDCSGDKKCTDILIKDTTIKTGRSGSNWQYRTFYTYDNTDSGYVVAENVKIQHCTLIGYFGNYNGKNVIVSRDTKVDGSADGLKRGD